MAEPISPRLSDDQLRTFAEHGSERTAEVGEVLYDVGDTHYPFIVILDGEAAIQDAAPPATRSSATALRGSSAS